MISALALGFAAILAQQSSCDNLKTVSVPNTKITSVEFVPAGPYRTQGRGGQQQSGPQLPAHCRIAAVLTPSADSHIEMELWLPADGWNGKFLAVGNGGWAGNIETGAMATALSRGYATASNDTGHKGGSASFAVGHPDKIIDFGYRSMHEMTVQSKALIQAFYSRAPQLSYYQGCSTGGRQGLMEAQRYPEDFDAIIAGAPVYNQVHLNTSQVPLQVEMLKDPSHLVPQAKVALFAKSVMAACDGKDGVKDGIVSDPQSCKFDPASLICKEGDGPDCLTAAQVESARKAYAPVKTRTGELVYPGHSPGFESGWRIPAPGVALNPLFGDMPRYLARQDANWDLMSFDLDKDLALALKNAGFIESNDPDLAKFKARGGKLLLYHGWADPGPAPENTIDYYSKVVQKTGKADGAQSQDWMRLFLLPGVGHCGGGVGPDRADYLTALEQWREKGTAPNQIIASRNRGGQVDMTRPLCPYPQIAKWSGSGSTDDAKNFVCTAK
ncbi:MAG TPA: tannase/feruloyl esterase family alpha/beta hydrolase [Terriglobia bacterium]|jgi:feruloyl esterase